MDSLKLHVVNHNIRDSIQEFFFNKNVLITGATGFMGKVLLEKLLSDCSSVGIIYLLMRPGKKNNEKEKLEKIIENPLFENLRKNCPEKLEKIKIINGDLVKINLGLSEEDQSILIEKVGVVYHVAASVRFNMPLGEAILLNVRGTREVCNLVLKMKNAVTFLHVSTAYAHIDNSVIEEKIYEPKGNWKEAIELAETCDKATLRIMEAKYIGNLPNSYVFTKSLAENLVVDKCEGKVQTIIVRPTMVMPAYKGPIPGWSNNLNGPLGILIGLNVGVIRAIHLNPHILYDYIPVDETINSMIKAVWFQQYLDSNTVSVYNSSCNDVYEINLKKMLDYGKESMECIVLKPLWHANLYCTTSRIMFYIHLILFHVLPLALVDLCLVLKGNKTRYVKLQRRIYLAIKVYSHFLLNSWVFRNKKCLELDEYLSEEDKAKFCHDLKNIDYKEYYFTAADVTRRLILKEDPKDQPIYKKQRIIFRFIHVGLKYLIIGLFTWVVYTLFFKDTVKNMITAYQTTKRSLAYNLNN